jgi:hypothetical protein
MELRLSGFPSGSSEAPDSIARIPIFGFRLTRRMLQTKRRRAGPSTLSLQDWRDFVRLVGNPEVGMKAWLTSGLPVIQE